MGIISSVKGYVSSIEYQHVLMTLMVISVTMLGLVLGGCTASTPAMRKLYFLSATYDQSAGSTATSANAPSAAFLSNVTDIIGGAALEVRGSFFGICVHQLSTLQGDTDWDWDCRSLKSMMAKYSQQQYAALDPLGLVVYMAKFGSEVLLYGLFIASMIICVLVSLNFASWPQWHTQVAENGSEHEMKPFPERWKLIATSFGSGLAFAFSLVSTTWVHVASMSAGTTLDHVFGGRVATNIGWLPLFFCWFAVLLQGIVVLGASTKAISVWQLDRLVLED